MCLLSFIFNDTATTQIYTLSLHDALPIFQRAAQAEAPIYGVNTGFGKLASQPISVEQVDALQLNLVRSHSAGETRVDRKSTRLNSSHLGISYAVFCLKKKKNIQLKHSNSC